MVRLLRNVFFVMASSLPMLAGAQGESPRRVDVSAGDLVTALDTLARQSGAQFIYQADQLKGHHSPGAHGMLSTDDALRQVLTGSGFGVRRDASGAMVIVRNPVPRNVPASSGASPGSAASPATPQATTRLQEVVVTGSRIPRAELEGPAPVVTITAREIQNRGFANVPALMTSLTQNLGALDNNQQHRRFLAWRAGGRPARPGAQPHAGAGERPAHRRLSAVLQRQQQLHGYLEPAPR